MELKCFNNMTDMFGTHLMCSAISFKGLGNGVSFTSLKRNNAQLS